MRLVQTSVAFAVAACRYWLTVYPHARRELRSWQRYARGIPDPALRRHALASHATKRTNSEGAAAFAILAPRRHRATLVRATVAYQAMYDYLDTISERPGAGVNLKTDNRHLHRALLDAVAREPHHADYYRLHPQHDDGGYLQALIDACREAFHHLPAHRAVEPAIRRGTHRAIDSQALTHAANRSAGDSTAALATWALAQVPPDGRWTWWEAAAACGSSLAVHALIATAADPATTERHAQAVEDVYHPWAGALQGLLDSLIDEAEDLHAGNVTLITHYRSDQEAGERLGELARQTLLRARNSPGAAGHPTILAGMTGMYLSSLDHARHTTPAVRQVMAALKPEAHLALAVFRLRHAANQALPKRTRSSVGRLSERVPSR